MSRPLLLVVGAAGSLGLVLGNSHHSNKRHSQTPSAKDERSLESPLVIVIGVAYMPRALLLDSLRGGNTYPPVGRPTGGYAWGGTRDQVLDYIVFGVEQSHEITS
jgi:hypothetical protein